MEQIPASKQLCVFDQSIFNQKLIGWNFGAWVLKMLLWKEGHSEVQTRRSYTLNVTCHMILFFPTEILEPNRPENKALICKTLAFSFNNS